MKIRLLRFIHLCVTFGITDQSERSHWTDASEINTVEESAPTCSHQQCNAVFGNLWLLALFVSVCVVAVVVGAKANDRQRRFTTVFFLILAILIVNRTWMNYSHLETSSKGKTWHISRYYSLKKPCTGSQYVFLNKCISIALKCMSIKTVLYWILSYCRHFFPLACAIKRLLKAADWLTYWYPWLQPKIVINMEASATTNIM